MVQSGIVTDHYMEYLHKTIEDLLDSFRPALGEDYSKYRNHVYRVFLNCQIFDTTGEHTEKYAIAAVFHDIGIWTDNTIDYLHPSIGQLEIFLTKTGKKAWINEMVLMVYWHHKVGKYSGPYEQTVENFRKSDWTDVSLGLLTFGADKGRIRHNRKMLPNQGFHVFLVRKIITNFFRHPLNPLPMFTS